MSGMIQNEGLNTKIGCRSLFAHQANGLLTASGVSVGLQDSTVKHVELGPNTVQLSGLTMITGDQIGFLASGADWWDLDGSRDIWAEVIFQSQETGGSTLVDWAIDFKAFDLGDALTFPASSADKRITFAAASPGEDEISSSGIKPLDKVGILDKASQNPEDATQNQMLLGLMVELVDDGSSSTPEISLIMVNLYYTLGMMDTEQRRIT